MGLKKEVEKLWVSKTFHFVAVINVSKICQKVLKRIRRKKSLVATSLERASNPLRDE